MAKPVAAFCSKVIGDPRPAQDTTANPRGTQKINLRTLGWLVGSSEAKKVPGLVRFFYRVFELPSPRNPQKRDKTKSRKNRFWVFVDVFVKTFRHDLFL
jgi:hypothetical protein